MFNKKRIKKNYAVIHGNGNSYFGRGLVQLTHGYNYKRIGHNIGLGDQLYDNPSLVLKVDISVKILCVGMLIGSFTSHKLENFFNHSEEDWLGARKIINGSDKKVLIKGYALNFLSFIEIMDETEASVKSMDAEPVVTEEMSPKIEDSSQIHIYSEADSKPGATNHEDHKHIITKPEDKENVLSYDEFLEKDVKS